MTVAEANRQYQIALEHKRTAKNALAGVLSAEDEIGHATWAEAEAWREAWLRWVELTPEQIGVA